MNNDSDQVRVKCPTCAVELDVRNSKKEYIKKVKCPMCGAVFGLRFAKYKPAASDVQPVSAAPAAAAQQRQQPQQQQRPSAMGGETEYRPAQQPAPQQASQETMFAPSNEGETQYMAPKQSAAPRIGHLLCNGMRYQLRQGRNTVGRRAMTSAADIQLDIDDRYVSRMQTEINVAVVGRIVKAVICNTQSKNPTYVNGRELLEGDAISLNDGDTISMGNTTIEYHE